MERDHISWGNVMVFLLVGSGFEYLPRDQLCCHSVILKQHL